MHDLLFAIGLAAAVEMSKDPTRPSPPLILVVDDEEAVREVVSDVLAGAGYRVLQASNGPETLALLARTLDVALLLSDVRMPGMNGFELAEAVAQLRPTLAVVFMSGYPVRQPDRGMKLLSKPFRVDRLLAFVADALVR